MFNLGTEYLKKYDNFTALYFSIKSEYLHRVSDSIPDEITTVQIGQWIFITMLYVKH
jgi:hypothetical protein